MHINVRLRVWLKGLDWINVVIKKARQARWVIKVELYLERCNRFQKVAIDLTICCQKSDQSNSVEIISHNCLFAVERINVTLAFQKCILITKN